MKRFGWIGLALACALLTSCGLLPEEETFGAAPVIREYEREEFQLAYVERGDLALTAKLSCTYRPVQTQTLTFPVGGLYYDEVFVGVGDSVKAGQVLAQLDLADVKAQIDSATLRLETVNLRLEALEENRALALERQRILGARDDAAALEAQLAAINERYDLDRQALTDEAYLLGLSLEEYQTRMAERQLRADFDGTVTYVRSLSEGERSVVGRRVIDIADSTMSLFRVSTEYWDRLQPGQEHEITVSKKVYEAVVASEAELGLPVPEKTPGKKAYAYLTLKVPDLELKDGDFGTMILVLDTRQDVLTIPESALHTSNGQPIVFYQDAEGMKAYKQVEIGLIAEKKVEIISGLAEGETVIVD